MEGESYVTVVSKSHLVSTVYFVSSFLDLSDYILLDSPAQLISPSPVASPATSSAACVVSCIQDVTRAAQTMESLLSCSQGQSCGRSIGT